MSRQARLGLVILLGLTTLVAILFILASQGNLLSRTFTVRATFDRVGGLLPGASVLYNGVSVGRVQAVELPTVPGQPIMVRMAVDEKAHPLIREDSRALIQTDGLVGNMIVALTDGSPRSPQVAQNGLITGVNPLDLSRVSDRVFESVARFDSLSTGLAFIMDDVRAGNGTLGRFLYDPALYDATVGATAEFQVTLRSVTARADNLVVIAEDATRGVASILQKVDAGDGTLARFLNDDEVYTTFLSTAAQLQAAAAQLQTISADVRTVTDRFNQAAGWASLGSFRFSENMEALKHNFLFRSYFEDRGYYEMAPFEVREQAISEQLSDLQEWERRLLQQQQELDAARAQMDSLRREVERRVVAPPPAD
jgi:phospholipid/cholesterol/gamma-HCH transport system substrate-binding protein